MRWIIAIVLSLGLVAGVFFGMQSWNELVAKQAELEHQRSVKAELENLKKRYDEEAGNIAQISTLWKQIKDVGLDPALWVTHPLEVSKTLPWEDFTNIMLLSANTVQTDGGYWFKPEQLRVLRVGGGAEAQAEDEPKKAEAVDLFETTIAGKFLIRKQ